MILTELMFGGLTGLIGGIGQKFFDYKSKKLEIDLQKIKGEQEIALRKADAEIMAQEWKARTVIAETEADAKMFEASHNEPELYSQNLKSISRQQGWLLIIVDFLRGIVRPGLTLYLCAVVTIMYTRTDGATINPQSIVDTILYLAVTAVTWWFGSRGPKK